MLRDKICNIAWGVWASLTNPYLALIPSYPMYTLSDLPICTYLLLLLCMLRCHIHFCKHITFKLFLKLSVSGWLWHGFLLPWVLNPFPELNILQPQGVRRVRLTFIGVHVLNSWSSGLVRATPFHCVKIPTKVNLLISFMLRERFLQNWTSFHFIKTTNIKQSMV